MNGLLTGGSEFYPTECVLCPFEGETHEEYEEHMSEAHGL